MNTAQKLHTDVLRLETPPGRRSRREDGKQEELRLRADSRDRWDTMGLSLRADAITSAQRS